MHHGILGSRKTRRLQESMTTLRDCASKHFTNYWLPEPRITCCMRYLVPRRCEICMTQSIWARRTTNYISHEERGPREPRTTSFTWMLVRQKLVRQRFVRLSFVRLELYKTELCKAGLCEADLSETGRSRLRALFIRRSRAL